MDFRIKLADLSKVLAQLMRQLGSALKVELQVLNSTQVNTSPKNRKRSPNTAPARVVAVDARLNSAVKSSLQLFANATDRHRDCVPRAPKANKKELLRSRRPCTRLPSRTHTDTQTHVR